MLIRKFSRDDAEALRSVFYASVHQLARGDYTASQLNAWAPAHYDRGQWAGRLARNAPFIAEIDNNIAGFADLQPSGHIDLFFVAPVFARRGVATALMNRLLQEAGRGGIALLEADVSLTAQPLFQQFGFTIVKCNTVSVRGVELQNATMQRDLR